jgi:tRNA(fMet)-specific endonuclease VapC
MSRFSPRYILDTNICIYLMKHEPPEVAARFAQCYEGEVVMSSITLGELEYGVAAAGSTSTKDQSRAASALKELCEFIPALPFDASAAHSYGAIRLATSERKRDALDKLIAAHAVSLDIVLVTNNVADFSSYPNLKVENWVNDTLV